MKRTALVLLTVLAALCLCSQAAADKTVTLTFTGDCTIGGEEAVRAHEDSFDSFAKLYGYDYFFKNFHDLFSSDDCTVVNCECVFSDSRSGENKDKSFRFRAPTDFVNIFKEGSVEAVSLANNHTKDYGAEAFEKMKTVLDDAGIGWAWDEHIWVFEKDGIRIGFGAIDYGIYKRSNYKVRDRLLLLRKEGLINAAVMMVHAGVEYSPKHYADQDVYAEYFIREAGVDLVIGHHPHVLQGIRILNNRTVFYSLGNFVFGGHNKVSRNWQQNTNSLYTMAVQVKMYFTDDGAYKGQQVVLYPAYDSGTDPLNNYQPMRVKAADAVPVIRAIQGDTRFSLPEIQTDDTGYSVVVMDYLPADPNSKEPAPTAAPATEPGEPEPAPARPNK